MIQKARHAITTVAAIVAAATFLTAHPDGVSVPINFGADEPPGVRSDVLGPAGVLGSEVWNNLDLNVGTDVLVLIDDQGDQDDSDVTVTWTSANTWASTGRGEENNTAPEGDDRNLMTGYLDTNADNPTLLTVSGLESISDESYSVYVYMNGGVLGRGGDYSIGDQLFTVVDNAPFDGGFNEGEDYVVFTGITGDSFTLSAQPTTGGTRRAPISALEVVFGTVGDRVVPVRAIDAAVSAEECPPGGRGPLSVTVTMPIPDGAAPGESLTISETVRGSLGAAAITGLPAGAVSDLLPTDRTDLGFIQTWLTLGPFQQGGGAAPGEDAMRLDYLTDGADIDEIDVEPSPGDTVQTDFGGAAASTGLAATTNGLNPGGVPTWTAYADLDGTMNFDDVYGANIDNVMMYAVAYVTLEDDYDVTLCVGSDDAVQILIDGVEFWINNVARGVGGANECQDLVPLGFLEAGRHMILAKVFEGGGGHQLRIGLQDSATGEPLPFSACYAPQDECALAPVGATISLDATRQELADGVSYGVDVSQGRVSFAGTIGEQIITGENSANLVCDTSPSDVACARGDGALEISWTNSSFAGDEEIQITANGTVIATLGSDAESATISHDDLADPFNLVCVTNAGGSACCRYLKEGIGLGDITGSGDGTGTAPEEIIGISAADGTFQTAYVNAAVGIVTNAWVPVVDSDLIDSVFIVDFEEMQINSDGVTFVLDPLDAPVLAGTTYNHILRDATHDVDKNIFDIWAGGRSDWASAVSIHSAAGITYDLDAIRAAHGEVETFSCFAGMDQCAGLTNLYVVTSDDGEVIESISVLQVGGNGGEPVEISLEEAKYLTLICGLGDQTNGCDHAVFANPHISLAGGGGDGPAFVRGDADGSGAINITDGIFILNFLFLGGAGPGCGDAADADNSGAINITDGIFVLNFLFLGGAAPPAPHPGCGPDAEGDADGVTCAASHAGCV